MKDHRVIELKTPGPFIDDPLTEILREGARKLFAMVWSDAYLLTGKDQSWIQKKVDIFLIPVWGLQGQKAISCYHLLITLTLNLFGPLIEQS